MGDQKAKAYELDSLSYYRKWNTSDFMGKGHIRKFKNPAIAIPGTQINSELAHIASKEGDLKKFEDSIERAAEVKKQRLMVKDLSAQLNARVYVSTAVGEPIKNIEQVISDKQLNLNAKPKNGDTAKEIQRFLKNVESNKFNYIGYVVTCGFKSIDYQIPETGDTAIHICVRKGMLETLEELLKYKGDPDMRNRLGNFPIHDAWMFWNTDKLHRTKEQRLEQEQKTYDIILKILSYGGFVDAQDQIGQSPLHIASRLGTIAVVTVILGFQADHMLRTNAGQTAADVAKEFGQHEVYKLLNIWSQIRHSMVHVDFVVVWKKFLDDYQAVISNEKSAETVLFELEMEMSINELERKSSQVLQIDDPLMRGSLIKTLKDPAPVRPWDEGWKEFVKNAKESGIVDMYTKLEIANKSRSKNSTANNSANVTARDDFNDCEEQNESATKVLNIRTPGKAAASHVKSLSVVGGYKKPVKHLRMPPGLTKRKFPQRIPPMPRPFPNALLTKQDSVRYDDTQVDSKDGIAGDGRGGDLVEASVDIMETDFLLPEKEATERPKSQLQQRRLHSAGLVTLDAKFLGFTKRPSTSSALFVALRTPSAPLGGTEEEYSLMRLITSQGRDFDLFEKNKPPDRHRLLLGHSKTPSKDTLGAYSEAIGVNSASSQDLIYSRVVMKTKTDREAAEEAVTLAANQKAQETATEEGEISEKYASSGVSPKKQDKVDMANNKRMRYVAIDLLPPVRKETVVESLIREKAERERVSVIAEAEKQNSSSIPVQGDVIIVAREPKIQYGAGRLQSTHMTKRPLIGL